jgi:hypothetical protein
MEASIRPGGLVHPAVGILTVCSLRLMTCGSGLLGVAEEQDRYGA